MEKNNESLEGFVVKMFDIKKLYITVLAFISSKKTYMFSIVGSFQRFQAWNR